MIRRLVSGLLETLSAKSRGRSQDREPLLTESDCLEIERFLSLGAAERIGLITSHEDS